MPLKPVIGDLLRCLDFRNAISKVYLLQERVTTGGGQEEGGIAIVPYCLPRLIIIPVFNFNVWPSDDFESPEPEAGGGGGSPPVYTSRSTKGKTAGVGAARTPAKKQANPEKGRPPEEPSAAATGAAARRNLNKRPVKRVEEGEQGGTGDEDSGEGERGGTESIERCIEG
jgi:hypothetical protein